MVSSSVAATGFSQKVGTPASTPCRSSGAWAGVAAAMTKPSTPDAEQLARVRREADPSRSATSRAASALASVTTSSSTKSRPLQGLGVEGADPSYACKPDPHSRSDPRRCVSTVPHALAATQAPGVVLSRSAWPHGGHTVNPLSLHSHVLSNPKLAATLRSWQSSLDVRIDRGSPVPLYHQLAEQLSHAIATGALQPGDPLRERDRPRRPPRPLAAHRPASDPRASSRRAAAAAARAGHDRGQPADPPARRA